MGKKLFLSFLAGLIFAPVSLAATLVSSYEVQIRAGTDREIAPIVITSVTDGDIMEEHGITIILPAGSEVNWEPAPPTLRGTAFDNQKLMLNLEVIYSEDSKTLHIPVLEDFDAGDYVILEDLILEAGNTGGEMRIGMDLDGDLVSDFDDVRKITVVDDPDRLLSVAEVRYKIKCLPSGIPVAENDSACLWARIDLVHAQEMFNEQRVEGVAISEKDLSLMAKRRRWSDKRFEDNCLAVNEPAKYCQSLEKALQKVSYFLD